MSHALDFRLRQAMQAVLTHLLLAAAASLSDVRGLDLVLVEDSVKVLGLLVTERIGWEASWMESLCSIGVDSGWLPRRSALLTLLGDADSD